MPSLRKKTSIILVPQGTTPFVTEEKPAWRQEQQRTFGKALGVAEQLATMKAKYITSEWYPFYQVYVHESESTPPIPLLTTTSGVTFDQCLSLPHVEWDHDAVGRIRTPTRVASFSWITCLSLSMCTVRPVWCGVAII